MGVAFSGSETRILFFASKISQSSTLSTLLSLSFSTSKPNQFEDLGKVKTFREYEKLLKEPEEDVETAKLFQEKGEQIGFTKDPHPNPGLRRNLPQFADGFSPSVEVVGKLEEIGQRRRVLELMIQGFDERMFEASERIILAAKMLPDAVVKGPTPVKTKLKKYTILKGPFKHKKARDQLGIQRYRRKIVIDTTRDVAEKFFEFLKENTPSLVAIRVK
eukprot:CAMPEP_0201504424 /NCGR_PEP_ID=MMETSP0151_2-20130828/85202_1 /ASSEMBLY_ACC=CAM_ASM_000257 /TAXON_ID=200890 /ORGANISM="Paramoeba atlantica, Strain 621/1 / CCAP 1560/9" /LENGTH=217 /DNA_ID=CAMNT_0047898165 /DNA_START=1162 /DNA_END=1812 /DNA_ORIENTATION=-